MTTEPKSVYELAEKLNRDGFDESSITIESGLLTFRTAHPFRKLPNSDKYADCIGITAYITRAPNESLKYAVHFSIIEHDYTEQGKPDISRIFTRSLQSASLVCFEPEGYIKFRRLIGNPWILLTTGLGVLEREIEDFLSNEENWNE
jgi:hypothetical protein